MSTNKVHPLFPEINSDYEEIQELNEILLNILYRSGLCAVVAGKSDLKSFLMVTLGNVLKERVQAGLSIKHTLSDDEIEELANVLSNISYKDAFERLSIHDINYDTEQSSISWLDLNDLMLLPAPEYLIEGLLPADSLSVVYGPPGNGKSFITIGWALSIAYDIPWNGIQVKAGGVVYLTGGEGVRGFGQRIRAWLKHHNLTPEDQKYPFKVVPSALNLMDNEKTDELIRKIRKIKEPRLIVVDTLAKHLIGGDENSAKDMGAFLHNCNRLKEALGCSVLIVHHSGKGEEKKYRGSSALHGDVETMIKIQKSAGTGRIQMYCEKNKEGEPFAPQILQLKTVDLPDGTNSCVVEYASGSAWDNLKESTRSILEALEDYPGSTATEIQCAAGVSPATWKRERKYLLEQGLIIQDEDGRYSINTNIQR